MQIANDTVVHIHYQLTDDEGELLDSSEGQSPLAYLHGHGQIIPGLEAALAGHSKGDRLEVIVEPEDAYGEHNPALVEVVPREAFRGVDEVRPGMFFQTQTPQGAQIIRVVAVEGDEVTIDANHPLAGKRLHFAVEVVDVRPATEDEIAHGHVHEGDIE